MSAPKPCLLCGTPKCKRWPCVRRWACKECYTRKGWGDKLKIGCERSGKTYKEIAALISRSPSTLYKYIINVTIPGELIRMDLAKVLGCNRCKHKNDKE